MDNADEHKATIIRLQPGDYFEEGNSLYALRICKNNTRLPYFSNQGPESWGVRTDSECGSELSTFSIEGIVVEGFPKNGIQTRFVDGFKFLQCKSIDNLNNGIYLTLSKNGLIDGCTAKVSLNAGVWIAGPR